jgi:RNA polymerase sigma factor (sigma-70 family)
MVSSDTSTGGKISNVKAAARIFIEYGDFIRMVIGYKVENEDRVDDLFQDLFLLLVSKPLPVGIRNTKSYLYKVIINGIIDDARRVQRYHNHTHRYAEHLSRSVTQHRPEDSLIEVEERNKMFTLIERQLRPSEAQAVTMRYRDHFSVKEVAEKMDVDSRSVSRYVSVGLRKIQHFLTGLRR